MSESETQGAPAPVDPRSGAEGLGEAAPLNEPPSAERGSPFTQETPRLGILHFLVAMAGVAITLGTTRLLQQQSQQLAPPGMQIESTIASNALSAVGGVGVGLAVASLGFAPARWRRGQRFPVWPGEWLLWVSGLTWVLCTPIRAWAIGRVAASSPAATVLAVWFVSVPLALNVLATVRVRIHPWRLYFALSALHWLCPVVAQALPLVARLLMMGSLFIGIVVLPVAMINDAVRRRTMPWTHWFGAWLALYIHVTPLFTTLVRAIFF
jgi:hypothetical protein